MKTSADYLAEAKEKLREVVALYEDAGPVMAKEMREARDTALKEWAKLPMGSDHFHVLEFDPPQVLKDLEYLCVRVRIFLKDGE